MLTHSHLRTHTHWVHSAYPTCTACYAPSQLSCRHPHVLTPWLSHNTRCQHCSLGADKPLRSHPSGQAHTGQLPARTHALVTRHSHMMSRSPCSYFPSQASRCHRQPPHSSVKTEPCLHFTGKMRVFSHRPTPRARHPGHMTLPREPRGSWPHRVRATQPRCHAHATPATS